MTNNPNNQGIDNAANQANGMNITILPGGTVTIPPGAIVNVNNIIAPSAAILDLFLQNPNVTANHSYVQHEAGLQEVHVLGNDADHAANE